jgi:CDGSH-type Zn-finger protein
MSEVKITVKESGALRVEGEIPIFDVEGNSLTIPIGKPYSLCTCSRSGRKPFCDGTHKTDE